MSKDPTYRSKTHGTVHTYDFYYNRKNDPNWRDDYLIVKKKRRRANVIALLTLTGMFIFFVMVSMHYPPLTDIVNKFHQYIEQFAQFMQNKKS